MCFHEVTVSTLEAPCDLCRCPSAASVLVCPTRMRLTASARQGEDGAARLSTARYRLAVRLPDPGRGSVTASGARKVGGHQASYAKAWIQVPVGQITR